MEPPSYFEEVRAESAEIWATLESSPTLAGPWHRMFQQVQSPRHVLSELLQNADDSGATWASVKIIDDTFVFEHNGRDFTKDEFASICRFGYSNKRALHTIGFRGVGFKSTFSLGKEVSLNTPSLSVKFSKSRFTEPVWVPGLHGSKLTSVGVRLSTFGASKEVERNLAEWLTSSTSLLFFRNIRTLVVSDTQLQWVECGKGPCPNSTWLRLNGSDQGPCLLIRSDVEPFPTEALEEIQAERILSDDEHLDLPPCSVELLLYGDSRLFVVLPTGVKTALPFAANAPFVQDTARLKVKDPDSSATNRWLLERIGRLAADSMLAWLGETGCEPQALVQAYDLMPNIDRQDSSLEGSCAATVEVAFEQAIKERNFVLADTHRLTPSGGCFDVPPELMEVWPAIELARILDRESQTVVSRHVSESNLQKLREWQAITTIPRGDVVQLLRRTSPVKPQSWKQLLRLWSYLASEIPSYEWGGNDLRGLHIVPVQGKSTLSPANEVIRLGEKKLLRSDDDWSFMSEHLRAYNPNWSRFLADQRLTAERQDDAVLAAHVERAFRLQNHLKLTESSDTSQVMRQVAQQFFKAEEVPTQDCIRIAHIAARLGASVGDDFLFLTNDDQLTPASYGVIADETGRIADVVPGSWAEAHVLHGSYWSDWGSCSRDEWSDWIVSGKASLGRFPALSSATKTFWSRKHFDDALESRGFAGTYETPYKTQHFELSDSDFESDLWAHWRSLAETDERFWARLVGLILAQGPAFWEKSLDARAFQVATTGSKRQIVSAGILTSWIRKLRDLPCLLDTRGIPRKPFEVMRRTAATEPLLEVEPFVPADIDTEANRPFLKALQVRSTPTGPKQILERIRALAESDMPPVEEIEKWYRRLDGLLLNCTSDEIREIRELFESEPLILSESHLWVRTPEVFLSSAEDEMPDSPLIRRSVRDLELWRRIHVADRPNAELILQWLRDVPTSTPLPSELWKRVRSALQRLGVTVWEQCGHWLNLAAEWVPTTDIKYSVSMRSLTKTQELFLAVKQATADFQMLDFENLDRYPFADVPSLASCLDEQVSDEAVRAFQARRKPWLECLAKNLGRIEVPSELEQARLRVAAARLAQTEWKQGEELETVPYLDDVPVGAARRVGAVWTGQTLYVSDVPIAHMATPVARELARGFDYAPIGEAVKFCFERDVSFVQDYLEQEFKLGPLQPLPDHPNEPQRKTADTQPSVPPTPVATQDYACPQTPEAEGDSASPDWAEQEQPTSPSTELEPPQERRRHTQGHPPKPSLVERFAVQQGLRHDGNGGFVGTEGEVLRRTQDGAFPWEYRTADQADWLNVMPIEHCLERESVLVDADVWGLLRSPGSKYALILLAPDSSPILRTGADLGHEIESRQLVLYPAKYRLSKVQ